eukprot:2079302-Rhodomonas_salina.2
MSGTDTEYAAWHCRVLTYSTKSGTLATVPVLTEAMLIPGAIGDNHLKPMIIPDPYVSHRLVNSLPTRTSY